MSCLIRLLQITHQSLPREQGPSMAWKELTDFFKAYAYRSTKDVFSIGCAFSILFWHTWVAYVPTDFLKAFGVAKT